MPAELLLWPDKASQLLQHRSHSSHALQCKAKLRCKGAQYRAVQRGPSASQHQQQTTDRQHARADRPAVDHASQSSPSLQPTRNYSPDSSGAPIEQVHHSSSAVPDKERQTESGSKAWSASGGRQAAQAGFWCWEWASTRWRASFFFLMASLAFVVGSAASLQPEAFAGTVSLCCFDAQMHSCLAAHAPKSAARAGHTEYSGLLHTAHACVPKKHAWNNHKHSKSELLEKGA